MDSNTLFNTLEEHLQPRQDEFYHLMAGPKRETWFVTELIAALWIRSPGTLSTGHRVYGEESYKRIMNLIEDTRVIDPSDESKLPDITALGDYASEVVYIAEAKRVDDPEPKCFGAGGGGLETQLDRAKRVFPKSKVFGIIFVVHHSGGRIGGKAVYLKPEEFYSHVVESVEKQMDMTKFEWSLPNEISPVRNFQSLGPIGGMFAATVSLGVGIIEHKGT